MQRNVIKQIESHQKLFDEMLTRFNISAKDLAEAANISENMISRFRRGKADLGTTKFLTILVTVPDEAKEWYVSRLLGAKPKVNLQSLVLESSPQEKAELLNALAVWAAQSRENKDSACLPQAV